MSDEPAEPSSGGGDGAASGAVEHVAPRPSVAPAHFDFAGWGTAERIDDLSTEGVEVEHLDQGHKHSLGTWASTAICGNDITSSCLYVSALVAVEAGVFAPLVLLLVALILFLFRFVYAEVGSALPLNGGTYTLLLNTTNKKLAAGAAVLTLLSYVATAVISAGEAMHYAHNLWHGLDIQTATLALLAFFALLNVVGVSESAVVALGIFITHMCTLVVLSVACTAALVQDPSVLFDNWGTASDITFGGLTRALFFGFAAAMLGISGFESSANFIEEQKPGVFPKTLRNMWVAVSVFNPLISILSIGILPLVMIQSGGADGGPPEDLLARMGNVALHQVTGSELSATDGTWLGTLVSIDAVLVLSGAVLTSFVGVTGLVRRMTLDRCLPQFLLAENKLRGTNHWIILGFLLVCGSILISTDGDVGTLASVYTISFLAVMAFFAAGNMMLKVKRSRLPRETQAGWTTVSIALVAVLIGLVLNVYKDLAGSLVFLAYMGIFGLAVAIMFARIQLMKATLFVTRAFVRRIRAVNNWLYAGLTGSIDKINSRVVVYFTRGDDSALLNRAALYVMENEQTNRLKVITVFDTEEDIPGELAKNLKVIDRLYPDLRIDFLAVKGEFGPELIEKLSQRLDVPKNYMFIGTPGDRFPHRIEALGGVRLIL